LAGYNLTIWLNDSGILDQVYNLYDDNIIVEQYNITNLTNSNDWCTSEPCEMIMNVTAWDDHNPLYNIEKENAEIFEHKNITSMIYEKGYINIETNNNVNIVENTENYNIMFSEKKETIVVLSSNSKMIFRNTKYKSHIYFPEIKKYFDLNSKNIKINDIIFKNNKYYIYCNILEKNTITNSIGDLNVNNQQVIFSIIERPTLSTALLSNINITLLNINSTNNNIYNEIRKITGGIEMLPYIILAITFLLLGFYTTYKILITFSGVTLFVLTFLLGQRMIEATTTMNNFYKAGYFLFFFISILFCIMGILLQINHWFVEKENKFLDLNNKKVKKQSKKFYPEY